MNEVKTKANTSFWEMFAHHCKDMMTNLVASVV